VSFLVVLGGLPPGSVPAGWVTRYGSGRGGVPFFWPVPRPPAPAWPTALTWSEACPPAGR